MEFEFLKSLVITLGVSALIVFILGRIKVSSVVGFLIAGIILGPHGLRLIEDLHNVEILAEIGIILLMFTIGLEFSLKNLFKLRRTVFGGGLLQVFLTTGSIAFLSLLLLQNRLNVAVFTGFLVSLSSTAIVMKILHEKGELYTPHSRMTLGIGVPRILHQIVSTRSRELFIITIILLCLGTALLTSLFGLSLTLGAFLAGIVISESEYSSQAISDILPFKESFTGIFFVSIGMLLNLSFLKINFPVIISAVIVILILKAITVSLSAYAFGQSLRGSIQTGLFLSQIGEFSFVLAVAGKASGLITDDKYQIFLAASIMTMIVTPFIINASAPVSSWLISRPVSQRFDRMRRLAETGDVHGRRSDHVIIIGFGMNGRNLAGVLRESEIPYVVLDLNNSTVRRMKKKGEPIYYGDGTRNEILHRLGIQTAKVLVIAISDAAATRRI